MTDETCFRPVKLKLEPRNNVKSVILEDDDTATPNPEATAEPSKLTDPSSHGPWCDIEDGAMLTTTSVQFLRLSRKVWLLHPRPPKASLTLSNPLP